jgi:hypothetical protein
MTSQPGCTRTIAELMPMALAACMVTLARHRSVSSLVPGELRVGHGRSRRSADTLAWQMIA